MIADYQKLRRLPQAGAGIAFHFAAPCYVTVLVIGDAIIATALIFAELFDVPLLRLHDERWRPPADRRSLQDDDADFRQPAQCTHQPSLGVTRRHNMTASLPFDEVPMHGQPDFWGAAAGQFQASFRSPTHMQRASLPRCLTAWSAYH